MEQLDEIASAFCCPGKYLGEERYGSGHINDTFKVVYDDGGREVQTIHQRVNDAVFSDIPALMENIGHVTRHQRLKLEQAGADDIERRVLTLIPTVDGQDFYQDHQGQFWRSYGFIEDAVGVDVVEHAGQAYEAARAFGEFQCQLANLPVRLHEVIPDFHHTRSRFRALINAAESDVLNRAAGVQAELGFVLKRENLVDTVIDLMKSGELPERVTHGDTKLNNVLLDVATGKGTCVIDLDTVMPGSVLYDFGDMVRTTTTTVAEDEVDLSRVTMDISYFEALVKGYLETASGFLVQKEKDLLAMSGQLITFEVGMRFLTDYLQGDSYFKTSRSGQNLDRCRKQFKLVQSMEKQMDDMQKLVEAVW